jgi:hypothetical protein
MDQSKFRFKIDDLTLETIPMKRLAEYLTDLATLVGEVKDVHLVGIESGSVEAILLTETPHARAIEARIHSAAQSNGVKPTGPREAIKAFKSLTDKLAEDKTGAVFMFEAGAEILRFPNRGRRHATVYGPFNQEGSLDGVVVRLGGVNDPVPVHLESDSGSYQCLASRTVARELAKHIFETTLRVYGIGRWTRTAEGEWTLESFTIRDFHPLSEEPLSAVVAKLRAVTGGGWAEIDDPVAEAKRIRDGDDEDG